MVPPSLRVQLRAVPSDLSVLAKVMPTPASEVSAPRVTASLKVCVPTVDTLPPLMSVLPAASVLRLASRSDAEPVPPTAPAKVVVPLSLRVKLRLPPLDFTALPRVIPKPVSVVFAPRITASL